MMPRPPTWPADVLQVLTTLEQAGYEAYVVGGSVRNELLGRSVVDFDVASSAPPETVQRLFERTVPTGIKHGTVTVLLGLPIEVTTFRVETGYSDGRRPDNVSYSDSIVIDLARRDFTMNAIAMDLRGAYVDPFGGRSDIAQRVIRAVGDPQERFREDGLRILRGFRFASELDFSIDEPTRAGMRAEADGLKKISVERIGQELFRLARTRWETVVSDFATGPWLSVLPQPWPLLASGFKWLDRHPQKLASWSTEVGDGCGTLPGVGPFMQRPDEVREVGRAVAAAATWIRCADCRAGTGQGLASAVRWTNRIAQLIDEVERVTELSVEIGDLRAWRSILFQHDPWSVWVWCCLEDWLTGASAYRERYALAASTQPLFNLRDLAVSGDDLLHLGLNGPRLGETLRMLCDAVLSGEVPNDRTLLLKCVQNSCIDEGPR